MSNEMVWRNLLFGDLDDISLADWIIVNYDKKLKSLSIIVNKFLYTRNAFVLRSRWLHEFFYMW